jgi:hypothetical protein
MRRISETGRRLAVTSNCSTLRKSIHYTRTEASNGMCLPRGERKLLVAVSLLSSLCVIVDIYSTGLCFAAEVCRNVHM